MTFAENRNFRKTIFHRHGPATRTHTHTLINIITSTVVRAQYSMRRFRFWLKSTRLHIGHPHPRTHTHTNGTGWNGTESKRIESCWVASAALFSFGFTSTVSVPHTPQLGEFRDFIYWVNCRLFCCGFAFCTSHNQPASHPPARPNAKYRIIIRKQMKFSFVTARRTYCFSLSKCLIKHRNAAYICILPYSVNRFFSFLFSSIFGIFSQFHRFSVPLVPRAHCVSATTNEKKRKKNMEFESANNNKHMRYTIT